MPITLDGTLGITTPALTVTGATVNTGGISTAGNLTFTSTGNRILGDFSNATVPSRVLFQTSTVNSQTALGLIPNGTSALSQFVAYNNSDVSGATAFQTAQLVALSTEASIRSGIGSGAPYIPMTFYTGGSERIRVLTTGEVGVGTTLPYSTLGVNSGFGTGTNSNTVGSSIGLVASGVTQPILGIRWTGVGQVGISGSNYVSQIIGDGANNNAIEIFTTTAKPLVFGTAATERMRIDSAGNVGIGTSSPATLLDVNGILTLRGAAGEGGELRLNNVANSATGLLLDIDGSNNVRVYNASNTAIQFFTNATTRMAISSSGVVTTNSIVGINGGATASDYAVSITGSSGVNGGLAIFDSTSAFSTILIQNTTAGYLGTRGSYPLVFQTNNTERMRITSAGVVLIGTTTTTNNQRLDAKLCIVSTGSSSYGGINLTNYSGTSAAVASFLDFNRSRGTTDGSMTAVASGDVLGYAAVFRGSDGTNFVNASQISSEVDGTVSTGVVPGRLIFSTSVTGTMVERMRITSIGNFKYSPSYTGTLSSGSYATLISNVSSTIGSAIKIYGHLSENGIVNVSFGEWIAVYSSNSGWFLNLISQPNSGSSYALLNIQFSGDNLQIKSAQNVALGQYSIVIDVYR